MPLKRSRKALKPTANKKAKRSQAIQDAPIARQAKLPVELLLKIFQSLDKVTATSFGLANKEIFFEKVYQDRLYGFAKVFGVKHVREAKFPYKLPLITTIYSEHSMTVTLKACLWTWMPPTLRYEPFLDKFVGPETWVERLAAISQLAEDAIETMENEEEDRLQMEREKSAEREEAEEEWDNAREERRANRIQARSDQMEVWDNFIADSPEEADDDASVNSDGYPNHIFEGLEDTDSENESEFEWPDDESESEDDEKRTLLLWAAGQE